MKTTRLFVILFSLTLLNGLLHGQVYEKLADYDGIKNINSESGTASPVTFYVIYDNYVFREGTKADWGFSVFIEGLEKGILFDAGTKPEIFEHNFKSIGIDPLTIDLIAISHEHLDHTGGIPSFVKMKTAIPVMMPVSLSSDFKRKMAGLGLKPVMIDAPSMICKNLYTSGEFKFSIPEEALVLDTKKGLVVLTGCAHPGINEMLRRIRNDFSKKIYMVCGGFHLMNKTDEEMKTIISGMKELGIIRCGATHCTGEKQIKMFRDAFGDNYVELGTGNKIVLD